MVYSGEVDSATIEKLRIGKKLNRLRCDKHYTFEDLATKSGLSKSLLADIEAGEVIPPIATLLILSKALNVSIAYFFEDIKTRDKISVTRKTDRIVIKRRPHHHAGEVDYRYETLEMRKPDKHMEPFFVEFKTMQTKDMVFVRHEGEEFLYLLEGVLEFRSDDRVEILYPGDSIYFESDINHSFRALSEKPAKSIVVVWNGP